MARKSASKNRIHEDEFIGFDDTFKSNILNRLKLDLKHKNETQKNLTKAIKENDVVVCSGPAGTGKTYIACMQALSELKANDKLKKIVLVKSVTTLKSEEIGFLKGTMEEKMEPFMYSFTGNFEKIVGKKNFEQLKLDGYIEILPIAYLRGVNIDNSIVIIDEVQNISIENIRTILTRLGENSKMIFLGDVKQIDSKNKYDSALKFLLENFNYVTGIGIIEFTKQDIIRHPLIPKIEDIFDMINEDNEEKRLARRSMENESINKEFKIDIPIKQKKVGFIQKIINFFS